MRLLRDNFGGDGYERDPTMGLWVRRASGQI